MLVSADWVVPAAEATPLRDGAVRVVGDSIEAVGPAADLRERFPADDEVRGTGSILAPGFVDAHQHLYGTLAHGIPLESAPTDFWSFLDDVWWKPVEDALDHAVIVAATEWVAAEFPANGVTRFSDVLEAPFALPDALLAQKAAVERLGNRAILSFEATERVSEANGQAGLAENQALIEACRDSELVSGMMSYRTTFTCSDDVIRRAFEMAADLDVLRHAHAKRGDPRAGVVPGARGCADLRALRVRWRRRRPHARLPVCAALGSEAAGHRRVRRAHRPHASLHRSGGGWDRPGVREPRRRRAGRSRLGRRHPRPLRGDARRLSDPQGQAPGPAGHVGLHRVRSGHGGGARVVGLDRVRRSEPGGSADLQLVRADPPSPLAGHNVRDQVVLWRIGRDVTDVMMAGEWRVRSGEVLGFDRERARARVAEQAERMWAAI